MLNVKLIDFDVGVSLGEMPLEDGTTRRVRTLMFKDNQTPGLVVSITLDEEATEAVRQTLDLQPSGLQVAHVMPPAPR